MSSPKFSKCFFFQVDVLYIFTGLFRKQLAPKNSPKPKRKRIFQPSIFRCYSTLVSGRIIFATWQVDFCPACFYSFCWCHVEVNGLVYRLQQSTCNATTICKTRFKKNKMVGIGIFDANMFWRKNRKIKNRGRRF